MNHCVPDFEMDDDYAIPTSSSLTRPKKPSMADDEIMELLWHNGQVVMQSQNQRSLKKSPPSKYHEADQPAPKEIRSSHHQQQSVADHLFMQEDEMASWLHYPLNDAHFDNDFCADLLYSAPCVTSTATTTTATPPIRATHQPAEAPRHLPAPNSVSASPSASASASASAVASSSRPPIPPARRTELDSSRVQNFVHFSRQKPRGEQLAGPSNSKSVVREFTVVDSSDTPAVVPESRASQAMPSSTEGASGGNNINGCATIGTATVASTQSAGLGIGASASSRENLATCEVTVTSSPGGSSASAEPQAHQKAAAAEDRKRKGREIADAECHSEDAEFESTDAKKLTRGSTSTKRSRAAEVHNLSERRRRDRINEKMRALQELIPRCNKSDKASMLDEAIEYLKSLQLQVQMMSMGCGMVPMMYPGVQQYMPAMGMGIGMGMGMELGMSRPMMPFPNVLAGSGLPTPTAAAHLGPRFPIPTFHMPPPVPAQDPSRLQPNNHSDSMLNSLGMQNPNQTRVPNFADPYQQYLGLHQMQLPLQQNQGMTQPSSSKPCNGREAEDHENHPPGTC